MAGTNARHLRAALDHHSGWIEEVDEQVVPRSMPARPVMEFLAEIVDVVANPFEILKARQGERVVREADLGRAYERDAVMNLLAAKPTPVVADLIGELKTQPIAEEFGHRRKAAYIER